jgi:hypothetical protein
MRQGVRITTDKKRDAKCISDALLAYESKIERDGKHWSVHFSATAPELTAVLTALKECLDENEIAMVKVLVDDRAYAMEGTT